MQVPFTFVESRYKGKDDCCNEHQPGEKEEVISAGKFAAAILILNKKVYATGKQISG